MKTIIYDGKSTRFELDEAEKAMRRARKADSIKVLLKPS